MCDSQNPVDLQIYPVIRVLWGMLSVVIALIINIISYCMKIFVYVQEP